jgi:hypothetical protein
MGEEDRERGKVRESTKASSDWDNGQGHCYSYLLILKKIFEGF